MRRRQGTLWQADGCDVSFSKKEEDSRRRPGQGKNGKGKSSDGEAGVLWYRRGWQGQVRPCGNLAVAPTLLPYME